MPRNSRIRPPQKPKDAKNPKSAMYFEGVPEDTKAKFKATCVLNGENMRDVLISLMRSYAQRGTAILPPPMLRKGNHCPFCKKKIKLEPASRVGRDLY